MGLTEVHPTMADLPLSVGVYAAAMTCSRSPTAPARPWWSGHPTWHWSAGVSLRAWAWTWRSWYAPSCWGASTRTWPTAPGNTWKSMVSSSSGSTSQLRWANVSYLLLDLGSNSVWSLSNTMNVALAWVKFALMGLLYWFPLQQLSLIMHS